MAEVKLPTREAWLVRACELLEKLFGEVGHAVPKKLKVSCGWPSVGALAEKKRRIGECWSDACSKSKHFEIFISPVLDDESRVLDVLLHEMVHAVVGLEAGHRSPFKRVAVALGLTGPMRATTAGDELKKRLNGMCRTLGGYPHREIVSMTNGRKKQGSRLLKAECDRPGCGYVVRVTAKWLDVGNPICPCGGILRAADDEDESDSDDGD